MLNILSAVIAGLFVGILARWFYPGDVDTGFFGTIALGIGGSLFAGLIISRGKNEFSKPGCLASVLGAMLLILIGRSLLG